MSENPSIDPIQVREERISHLETKLEITEQALEWCMAIINLNPQILTEHGKAYFKKLHEVLGK